MYFDPPIALQLGPIAIRWYGIIITTGFIAGIAVALRNCKLFRWSQDDLIDFALLLIPCAIIGARAYYVATSWSDFTAHPADVFKTWTGGLAIYGGIIGGVLAAFIFCKVRKKNFFELLDIGMPGIALGQAIGRWGNFVNQEAFGPIVTNPALQWFPYSVFIQADQQHHMATFFYESMWCLLLFVFLMFMRKKFRHRGDIALSYLMLYGLERAFVEGLRMDSLYIGSFRASQLLSILLVVSIAVFFILRRIREGSHPVLITNKANPSFVWPVDAATETTTDQSNSSLPE